MPPASPKRRPLVSPNTLGDVWAIAYRKLFHITELRELSAMRWLYTCHQKGVAMIEKDWVIRNLCKPLHIDQWAHFARISHQRVMLSETQIRLTRPSDDRQDHRCQ